ncbi:MAG: hypothetical protein U1A78_35090 [Polyangia bacterium]
MIILLHGTGDDDSKAENWMPWVAKIMERYGEKVLTIPGVASEQKGLVGRNALEFLQKLGNANQGRRVNRAEAIGHFPDLGKALLAAGGELLAALKVSPGKEKETIEQLVANQKGEASRSAHGIKFRAAIACCCALYYYRRMPVAQLRPVRIIGHSRGGATAIALHNLLTSYGIPCHHTLTLDPCHGASAAMERGAAIGSIVPIVGTLAGALIGGAIGAESGYKDYYHRVWTGTVHNIPCYKEVGDMAVSYTGRPPITVGTGGNAAVTNHAPKLPHIKHGHMGKIRGLSEKQKDTARQWLTDQISALVQRQHVSVAEHLRQVLDGRFVAHDSDYQDRVVIANAVIQTLTS